MNIGDQYADDIYNINQMNLNGGVIRANNVFVGAGAEKITLVADQDQAALKAQSEISYLDFVTADHEKKLLIEREVVPEILDLVSTMEDLPIVGSPGMGKTCILYSLSLKLSNVVYLSLDNKSPLAVLSHLINKINLSQNLPLMSITTVDSGLEILQGLLLGSRMTFLLDNCESGAEIVTGLLSLRKLDNRFIYASRSELEFLDQGVEPFWVKNFSFEEVKVYLRDTGIALEVMALNALFEASEGNPLYLYYFTKFQTSPLPKDISDYHRTIWSKLSSKQQQGLIFMALSYKPIEVSVINALLDFEYATQGVDFINSLLSLIKNEDGCFEIFHPSFKQYIIAHLNSSRLLDHYQEFLGNYYLQQKDEVQAAYLLIDKNPKALYELGNDVFHRLIHEGDLFFATRLMKAVLPFANGDFEKGYYHYHLSFNLRVLNQNEESRFHQEQALIFFKKLKDQTWYNISLMNSAVSLVEDGKVSEGIALADQILEDAKIAGSEIEGQLLVNMSKMYVDISEFEKAAQAALKAYRIFEKKEHVFGMVSSLANLSSALVKLKDYVDLGCSYAEKLLEYGDSGISYNIELIALNILTSANRQKRKFNEAKTYGLKAVQLCQHYKLENKAVLNLINYGNVLRDAGEHAPCLKVYDEALLAANRMGLIREESRIYWILASIYMDKNQYPEALERIKSSIAKAKEINYRYGIAHGYQEKGRIYQGLGDPQMAAVYFEKSARLFAEFDFDEKAVSLKKAVLQYLQMGDSDKANALLKESAGFLKDSGFADLGTLLEASPGALDIHGYYLILSENYLKQQDAINLSYDYTTYLAYCASSVKESKIHFNKLLAYFAANLDANRFSKPLLALLVEQSKELVAERELRDLLVILSRELKGFYYRETAHETILLLKTANGFKLEITCYTEDTITAKLALSIALFLHASPELLVIDKEIMQDFSKVQIFTRKDFAQLLPDIKLPRPDGKVLVYHLEKAVHSIPNFIVVDDGYERASDLAIDVDNKNFMYFVNATVRSLISDYYQISLDEVYDLAKSLTRKIAYLMGLTGLEEIASRKDAYFVDLEKLDELMKQHATIDGRIG